MQVREIRLVRTKGDLTSRGFAFVEFHSLAAARAILAAAEPIVAKVDALMTLCDALEARLTATRALHAQFAAAAVHHLDV